MKTFANHDHYSLAELRQMLRDTDSQQKPALYNLLQSEIERREDSERLHESVASPLVSPETDSRGIKSLFLKIVSWVVGCQYALILCLGIIRPYITHQGAPSSQQIQDGYTFQLWCCELVMVAVGIAIMSWALRNTTDKSAVKAWKILAAGLAPASSYLTLELLMFWILNYLTKPSDEAPALGAIALWFLTIPLHFYLPFIAFTIWVRLRYHRNEF